MTELWELENEIYAEGFSLICGVDEAGRGPLAGPVYAAAVILPRDAVIDGLNDSKKLTEKKRDALFDVITERALTYGIASASVEEIEEFNILNATFLAMNRAVAKLDPAPELAPKTHRLNTNSRPLTMETPLMGTVPTCPTMMLSSRDTKLVMPFWMIMGTATPKTRR